MKIYNPSFITVIETSEPVTEECIQTEVNIPQHFSPLVWFTDTQLIASYQNGIYLVDSSSGDILHSLGNTTSNGPHTCHLYDVTIEGNLAANESPLVFMLKLTPLNQGDLTTIIFNP